MYANGNTISGQRSSPSLTKPHTDRDSTGDGLIVKLYFEKEGQLQDANVNTAAAVKNAKVRKDIESLAEKTKAQREVTSTVVKLKKLNLTLLRLIFSRRGRLLSASVTTTLLKV